MSLGGGNIEPSPEKGFVKAELTIEDWYGRLTRAPYGRPYIGFLNGEYGKLSPQLYNYLCVEESYNEESFPAVQECVICSDGPFYYNGIKYQENETGNHVNILWDEWNSLNGQTVDVWLKR